MNYRHIGVFMLILACSYFAQAFYWIARETSISFSVFSNSQELSNFQGLFGAIFLFFAFTAYFFLGIGALAIRFAGAINAVSASYKFLRKGPASLASAKGRIANAIFCEGVYWGFFVLQFVSLLIYASNSGGALFVPVSSTTANFLILSYSLGILLIAPFLIALSFKFRRNPLDLNAIARSKLFWIAFINYIVALWANYALRWSEVVVYNGVKGLLFENSYIGFFNSTITLFLAVIFAVAAVFPVLKKRGGPVLKWLGLSLTLVGLHFLILIAYTAYYGVLANAVVYRLKLMMLSDVWPVAALGLGLYVYLNRPGRTRIQDVENQEPPKNAQQSILGQT